MCGRYDRKYSPSDVDVYCGQFTKIGDRNVRVQRYHACQIETEGGTKRCKSVCGLLQRNLDEIDEEVQYDLLEAAEESELPQCGLCAESGAFGRLSDGD